MLGVLELDQSDKVEPTVDAVGRVVPVDDEMGDVALMVLAADMVVPVGEENDRDILSAEPVIEYECEVLHLVNAEIGIEKEISELGDSGCACVCAYGCHGEHVYGIRRGGVGKTSLDACCFVDLAGGHNLGLPWLGVSEGCGREGDRNYMDSELT